MNADSIPKHLRKYFPCLVCGWLKRPTSARGNKLVNDMVGQKAMMGIGALLIRIELVRAVLDWVQSHCPICSGTGVYFDWKAGRKWLGEREWYIIEAHDGEPFGTFYVKCDKGSKRILGKGPDDESALLDVVEQVDKKVKG